MPNPRRPQRCDPCYRIHKQCNKQRPTCGTCSTAPGKPCTWLIADGVVLPGVDTSEIVDSSGNYRPGVNLRDFQHTTAPKRTRNRDQAEIVRPEPESSQTFNTRTSHPRANRNVPLKSICTIEEQELSDKDTTETIEGSQDSLLHHPRRRRPTAAEKRLKEAQQRSFAEAEPPDSTSADKLQFWLSNEVLRREPDAQRAFEENWGQAMLAFEILHQTRQSHSWSSDIRLEMDRCEQRDLEKFVKDVIAMGVDNGVVVWDERRGKPIVRKDLKDARLIMRSESQMAGADT